MSACRRPAYLGSTISTAFPRISSSRLSPNTTSPSPPVLAAGAHSGATITMYTAHPKVTDQLSAPCSGTEDGIRLGRRRAQRIAPRPTLVTIVTVVLPPNAAVSHQSHGYPEYLTRSPKVIPGPGPQRDDGPSWSLWRHRWTIVARCRGGRGRRGSSGAAEILH